MLGNVVTATASSSASRGAQGAFQYLMGTGKGAEGSGPKLALESDYPYRGADSFCRDRTKAVTDSPARIKVAPRAALPPCDVHPRLCPTVETLTAVASRRGVCGASSAVAGMQWSFDCRPIAAAGGVSAVSSMVVIGIYLKHVCS